MAAVHGKNTYFNLDTQAGSPTDLSAYCDNLDFSQALDTAETTVFGNSAKAYIAGLQDGTFSVSGPFDPTLDAHMTAIMASHPASLTFIYGPQGSTGGQRRYTGECILTDYSPGSPVGDKASFSASFQITGTVTRDTF